MMLTLFSTLGCHLCDQAMLLLKASPAATNMTLTVVDIGESDALIERYGVRIPVLRWSDSRFGERELGWPFDQEQLDAWLSATLAMSSRL